MVFRNTWRNGKSKSTGCQEKIPKKFEGNPNGPHLGFCGAGFSNWTCETTRLVVSQVLQIWLISCRNQPNLPFFSGSCSITEVIEQLYSQFWKK
jgi:hypothetical protein